jgi:PAS domain-containing protein
MPQQEIELILSRHWASNLNTPIFLVDTEGDLLYYNESAEPILGRRFSETGPMNADEWSVIFLITNEQHQLLEPEELPLTIALRERRPVHMRIWIAGLDNIRRLIQTTCFPIIGQADRFLGALALFWEIERR